MESVAPSSPLGALSLPPPEIKKPFNLKDIFAQIGERVCQVSTLRGRCSGILLEGKKVLIPFHAITIQEVKFSTDQKTFYVFDVTISCRNTTYEAECISTQTLETISYYDWCLFEIIDNDFIPTEPLPQFLEDPSPGDEVFFAGYPIDQTTPSFHKGYVSSVEEEALCFNIDAPIMPGNSGGPVFIMNGDKLCLIGAIFAGLAQVDPLITQCKELINQRLSQSLIEIGGVNVSRVLGHTLEIVLNNLSTGIGKVMHSRNLEKIFSQEPLPAATSPLKTGFPVMKTEHFTGHLGTDPEFLDWCHHRVKQKPSMCGAILGKTLGAADQIDKEDEKALYDYYLKHILNSPSKGYSGYVKTVESQLEQLENKILEAKRKALKQNKASWESLLQKYQKEFPEHLQKKITNLLAILEKN